MKKFLCIFFAAVFIAVLSGCSSSDYLTDNDVINSYLSLDYSESPEDIIKIFGESYNKSEKDEDGYYSLHYGIDLPNNGWFIFHIGFKDGKMFSRDVDFYDLVKKGYPPKKFASLEQYKQIKESMTYDEVVSVLGMDGVKTMRVDASETEGGIYEYYHWPLKDSEYSDIIITFTNGAVSQMTT